MYTKLICRECSATFEKRNANLNQALNKGQKLFFCSVKCANVRKLGAPKYPSEKVPCKSWGELFERSCSVHGQRRITCSTNCARSLGARSGGEKRYAAFIERWRQGLEDGMRGKEGISGHIRRFLFEKYNSRCCLCGWNKIHPTTGNVPLQIDHIDGNWTNNKEDNLRLICPCCHSLTLTYGSLNKGNGRPAGNEAKKQSYGRHRQGTNPA